MRRDSGAVDWSQACLATGNNCDGVPECGCSSVAGGDAVDWSKAAFRTGASPVPASSCECSSGSAALASQRAEDGAVEPQWAVDLAAVHGLDLEARLRQRRQQLAASARGGSDGGPLDWGEALADQASPRRGTRAASRASSDRLVGYDETTGGTTGESWLPGDPDIPEREEEPARASCACEADDHVTVYARDVASLRGQCTIRLGYCDYYGEELVYTVACDARETSKKELWQYYLPEWVAKRTIKLSTAGSSIFSDPFAEPGLFWNGAGGFMKGALQFALVTLHSYIAELVDGCEVFTEPCGFSAAQFRNSVESGGLSHTHWGMPTLWGIEVADILGGIEGQIEVVYGVVSANYDDADEDADASGIAAMTPGAWLPSWAGLTWTALTLMGKQSFESAALADYFFWWGTRAHAAYLDTGDPLAERVARMCVRAAMAEIAALAGLLIHEYSHVSGSFYEDFEGPSSCQNACHHMLGHIVNQRLLARFGCPVPLTLSDTSQTFYQWKVNRSGGVEITDPEDRFDFAGSATDGFELEGAIAASVADSSTGTDLNFVHVNPFRMYHDVTVSWDGEGNLACWDTVGGLGSDDSITFTNPGAGATH